MKTPLGKFLSHFPAVLFSPEDLSLIGGEPSGRRKFLDLLLTETENGYLSHLLTYQKVVKHRNALLRRIADSESSRLELALWDEELAKKALPILSARHELLEFLIGKSPIFWQQITTKGIFSLHTEGQTAKLKHPSIEQLTNLLAERHDRDIATGTTSIGPHRDDFALLLDGKPLATHGSRGEWRSAVLALKLAELHFLEERCGKKPLLLLDDILSELDSERQKTILSLATEYQTIITTTDATDIPELSGEVWRIENGKIER